MCCFIRRLWDGAGKGFVGLGRELGGEKGGGVSMELVEDLGPGIGIGHGKRRL